MGSDTMEPQLDVTDISVMFNVSNSKVLKVLSRHGLGRMVGNKILVNQCDIIGLDFSYQRRKTLFQIINQRNNSREGIYAFFGRQFDNQNRTKNFALETQSPIVKSTYKTLTDGWKI